MDFSFKADCFPEVSKNKKEAWELLLYYFCGGSGLPIFK